MNPETKQEVYREGSKVYDAAGATIMTFTPINRIHQHLCAFHIYACAHRRYRVVLSTDQLSAKTTPVMWRLTIFAVTARRIFIRYDPMHVLTFFHSPFISV
jgi:hypothetical protein